MSSDGVLDRLAAKTDLVLYDLKVMDEVRHREMTGVSNAPILENLKRLAARGTAIWVRVPLVRGVNDDDDNIRRTIAFLGSLGTVERVGLLPYHSGGLEKARRIGKEKDFRRFEPPSEERIAAVEAAFREAGFEVRRGG
jgi:pyruvate formate lyase activating enzyme